MPEVKDTHFQKAPKLVTCRLFAWWCLKVHKSCCGPMSLKRGLTDLRAAWLLPAWTAQRLDSAMEEKHKGREGRCFQNALMLAVSNRDVNQWCAFKKLKMIKMIRYTILANSNLNDVTSTCVLSALTFLLYAFCSVFCLHWICISNPLHLQ